MKKNFLFGSVYWNNTGKSLKNDKNNFSNTKLTLSVNKIEIPTEEQYYSIKNNIICCMLGYFNNLEEVCTMYSVHSKNIGDTISELYIKNGSSVFSELDGIFIIFLFDGDNDIGYLYQPLHGNSLPLYYYSTDDEFNFSTSLRPILKLINKRELNSTAAKNFLHFYYLVPDKNTLVRNVYKIIPGTYLVIDVKRRKCITRKIKPVWKKISLDFAKNNLMGSLKENFKNTFKNIDEQHFAVTHTKGWDTNLLLFFTNELTKNTINAVTINGGGEVNEVPYTKEIQKSYDNIRSLTAEVHNNLDQLVNLAWIYEGYIFQEGFFLRYELSKLLKNENITSVILGASGDQILFPSQGFRKIIRDYPDFRYLLEYIVRRHCTKERILRKRMKKTVRHLQFDPDIEMLIKMHGIILNYHGVQSIYPYINLKTKHLSRRLGFLNYKKKFYIEKVKEILPLEIVQHLSKSRNVVDTKNLFSFDKVMLSKIFNSQMIKQVLSKAQIKQILNKPEDYHLVVLQTIYLYIFDALFLIGDYDDKFEEFYLNKGIEDLIH
ncbi:MAG: hypothetical protein JW894_01405 [Bacteroidales bacterium]|nr:hypothetical protein [Bacteroidales bacterium]